MMYWGPGFGWGGMIIGGLMMLLFWGALIVLAFFAIRALTRSGSWQVRDSSRAVNRSEDNALVILKERYARGEITKAEYDQIASDLR